MHGVCKKAYILPQDRQLLLDTCGYIPKGYEALLTDPMSERSDKPRSITTKEATLWADPTACASPTPVKNYVCMHTLADVVSNTGIVDTKRIQPIAEYPGVWKVTWGLPITFTIPPGYYVDRYALEGVYVNY